MIWIGCVIGMFIGANVGLFIAALCLASGKADDATKKFQIQDDRKWRENE